MTRSTAVLAAAWSLILAAAVLALALGGVR